MKAKDKTNETGGASERGETKVSRCESNTMPDSASITRGFYLPSHVQGQQTASHLSDAVESAQSVHSNLNDTQDANIGVFLSSVLFMDRMINNIKTRSR